MPGIVAFVALAALSGGWSGQPAAAIPIPRGPDLRITQAVSPAPLIAGAKSVHTVTVANTGDEDAEDVEIIIDPSMRIAGPLPHDCVSEGQTVTCGGTGMTLAPGESVTYEIPVTTDPALPDGTNITSRAQAAAPGTRGDATELISRARTMTDVEIVKTGPPTAKTGRVVTYRLTVTNHGPSQATDVTVRDPTAELSDRPAECPGPALTCPLGTLAPGESRTFPFTVTPATTGVTADCATVHTGSRDANAANNRSCASTRVRPLRSAIFTPRSTHATPTPANGPPTGRRADPGPDAKPKAPRGGEGPGLHESRPEPVGGEAPQPRPGRGSRRDQDTLPMTGVSMWMLGLGMAVLLAIGLLVRHFSGRDRADPP
ncbi:DUF7507 domain-containing protein [Nonomuraea sp. H19]|uniref:DUF7507 domain-containing protein n=1 Tax=Nonomuraea sp. H19 TaxID=3452206 RepID=UPI003F8BBE33